MDPAVRPRGSGLSMSKQDGKLPAWVIWVAASLVVSLILSRIIGPSAFFLFLLVPLGLTGRLLSRREDKDDGPRTPTSRR